jgi:hypothetical protein
VFHAGDACQAALETSQFFRQFVFDGFSSRLTNVIRKIEQIAFTAIHTRLAALLLELDDRGVGKITHQDRALRVIVGAAVISLVFVGPQTAWGWLGLVPVVTGLVGNCPVYSLLGVSTCSLKQQQ